MKLANLGLAAIAALTGASSAHAQSDAIADFYKSHPITWIIGTGEGGGYDFSSRLAAQHLAKHIPGRPTIVPRNMPGAGSIAAAEYVFTNGPKDGTMVAMFQPTFILEKFTNPARK